MIWIVLIVMSLVMFKLGMLTVAVTLLSIGLKAALFVIIVLVCLTVLSWVRCRRSRI